MYRMSQTLVEILGIKTTGPLAPSSFYQALRISECGKDHFVLHKQTDDNGIVKNTKVEYPTRIELLDDFSSPSLKNWEETNELCGYSIGPQALISAYLMYHRKENEPHI